MLPRQQLIRRLKESFAAPGVVQKKVAEALDVSEGHVSKWANGKQVPNSVYLTQLPDLLGVDPGWLLTGQEPVPRDLRMEDTVTRLSLIRLAAEVAQPLTGDRYARARRLLEELSGDGTGTDTAGGHGSGS